MRFTECSLLSLIYLCVTSIKIIDFFPSTVQILLVFEVFIRQQRNKSIFVFFFYIFRTTKRSTLKKKKKAEINK